MSETGREIRAGLNELHIARLFKCAVKDDDTARVALEPNDLGDRLKAPQTSQWSPLSHCGAS